MTQTPAGNDQQPPAAVPVVPVVNDPKDPNSQTPPALPSGDSQIPPASKPEENKVVPINALHEEREKRQQLQAQVDSMKKIMANNVLFDVNGNPVAANNQQPQQQQEPQAQQQYQQDLDKLWENDPRKAVQTEIYSAMMWRDKVDATLEQQSAEVSQKNPDFNTYRPEIMAYMRTLPLNQRDKPGMVEAAYYFIRGQKVDNIVATTRQQMEQEYLKKMQAGEFAQNLPTGATSQPPVNQGAVKLSDDQKNAAAVMGLTEADYARYVVVK